MNALRVSSYASWNEWLHVKSILVDASPAEQAEKLPRCSSIVSMWRVRGAVPYSIDMSCQLVELLCSDTALSSPQASGPPKFSEQELAQLYSLAVIRAVNGITEPSQQGYFARSVLSIAENLGLPGWIVELRHEATHGSTLPSLSVLRAAATYLLGWYTDHYWTPQAQELGAVTMQCLRPLQKQDSNSAPTFISDFLAPLFVTSCLNCAQPPHLALPSSSDSSSSSSSSSSSATNTAENPSSSVSLRDCLDDWGKRLSALSPTAYQTALSTIAARLIHEALHTIQSPSIDTLVTSCKLSTLLTCMQEIDSLMGNSKDCRRNARFLPALWQCWQLAAPSSHPFANHCPAIEDIDRMLQLWAADATAIEIVDKRLRLTTQKAEVKSEAEAATQPAPAAESKKRALDEMEGWLMQLSQKAPKSGKTTMATNKKMAKARKDVETETEENSMVCLPDHQISFADLSQKRLDGASKLCVDYPLWPVGLLPGEFEPVALLSLREQPMTIAVDCPSIRTVER